MFTQMQKYHKMFLISVTVLIAASFGMGTIFMNLTNPQDNEILGTFADKKISVSRMQFANSMDRWRSFFKFADFLSPKAQKIQKVVPGEDPKNFRHLFYMENPVWDSIYSLKESIVTLDQRLDERLNNPMKWKALIEGSMDYLLPGAAVYPPKMEEFEFYYSLNAQDREKAAQGITKNDVWNFLMLLHQAKEWGVEVGEGEINNFLADTQKGFQTAYDYYERLRNLRLTPSTMSQAAKEILTILKYLQARNTGAKISTKAVYETYNQYHTKNRMQWLKVSHKSLGLEEEKNYTQERVAFFLEQSKNNPEYFKLPAIAEFDYISVNGTNFLNAVTVSKEEVDKAYQEERKAKKDSDKEEEEDTKVTEKKIKEDEARIEKQLRFQKANQKAYTFLNEIREKIASLGNSAPLAEIAKEHNLQYQNRKDVAENHFFSKEDKTPLGGKELVYKNLKVGEISSVLASDNQDIKTYYCFRLLNKADAKYLTKEEIEKDDEYFLQCYYENNKVQFRTPERYRIAYVFANEKDLSSNLLVTTNEMKVFYDEYKDPLYKIASDKKEEPASYKPFDEVKEDLEKRVANFVRIKEIQKVQIAHKLCKDRGKDLVLSVMIPEIARQVMIVPDALKFVEETQLLTKEEIKEKNPLGISDFVDSLDKKGEISDVKDFENGKYFYQVLAYEEEQDGDFEKVQAKVKEAFLKSRALAKLRDKLASWKNQYEVQYKEAKKSIEEDYDAKIVALLKDKDKKQEEERKSIEAELNTLSREKQQRLEKLSIDIFHALCIEKGVNCETTSVFENIQELKELKNLPGMELLLSLNAGEVSSQIVDSEKGDAYLFQMAEKTVPVLSQIPMDAQERIRKILWARAYRSRLLMFLVHNKIRKEMGLEIQDEDALDEEEVSVD